MYKVTFEQNVFMGSNRVAYYDTREEAEDAAQCYKMSSDANRAYVERVENKEQARA